MANAKNGYKMAFLAFKTIKAININKLKRKIGQKDTPKYDVMTKLFGEIIGLMAQRKLLSSPITAKMPTRNISILLPNDLFLPFSPISFSCFV